jgi:P27 family predicted phage terminase small subunit
MTAPTPLHLKVLKGNPGKRPLRPEVEPQYLDEPPPPPDHLSTFAREEWVRLAPELVRMRLLSSADTGSFAIYCDAFGRWKTAVIANNSTSKKDFEGRWELSKTINGAGAVMLSLSQQFGLTPMARARLANAGHIPAKASSKFAGLVEQ